ncbi:uncharacterized protein PHALS_15237 [Plasmopara halstedii]|uniref:Uncharacterized protein n=1 Tax=Plasmopara halstedii TaxID=4781 RepID=A0A0N7L8G4_PLAHL|nr:uncharacterized protein PHALS_15237 [Plasmopara halstedii]CEG49803.1 hypothetical protein PHALS_15237 [Plasmopara halstedii]|eukprot:XP_024586172.1 hypothetical protein PHALS_15237 [Plasmopara halstedii]
MIEIKQTASNEGYNLIASRSVDSAYEAAFNIQHGLLTETSAKKKAKTNLLQMTRLVVCGDKQPIRP